MTINVSHFRQEVSKVRLSKDAFAELLTIRELFETVSQGVRFDTKVACINPLQSSVLREELNRIRNMIDHESHVLILDGFKVDKLSTFKSLVWTFGSLLGVPMVQNHLGHKVIEVYDRGGKSIEEVARYHQTRQGAYVHNDGVSDPLPIDYLILACGQKALLGGESILIDASAVYAELMAFPEVLEALKCDFFFENRGMSEDEKLFKAPILSFSSEGIPLIRYFRVYIESAHLKAGVPLTAAQTQALDFLDTVLDQSSVQHRVLLEPGQVLISADNKFLHTRTHFIDMNAPRSEINDAESLSGLNRYMLRLWLRKR
ncbi:TauD/TfdA family dioxygenase [Pseudomonas carnis]|uniref:TauD/TfdA family dioxygenase n=1 Tax=Pseudomonas carnis TaxID=2487355 RepID=UPI0018E5E4A9|nr:TauD/TfdA family dioxygenase [Pseudomonas carnis]MBI6658902.1 TauD/TfdA family dioxygenase [Pseudomonas carnis]MBI6662860.1 TauD/TfdA family dioxygenase [Pseudomonas carnis]MBI6688209.1 TauD/TfdA family dioxygenase [Pseudomonas carnis]